MNKIGYTLLFFSLLQAGDVCLKTDKSFADIKVFVVDSKRSAELRVYITDSKVEGDGNDGIWHFTSGYMFTTPSIAFTTYAYEADITVCFVEHAFEAGWKKRILLNTRHKLKGEFK